MGRNGQRTSWLNSGPPGSGGPGDARMPNWRRCGTGSSRLKEGFGKPHVHAGAGIRRLSPRVLEFRISRGLRVVFLFVKPRTFRLIMIGNHDEVRAWLKENA